MKIAVSGKGGTGKTTISSLLCRQLAATGREVIAVDADSNPNLAYALNAPDPEKIVPLADMEDLILEKTGAEKGRYGAYFKMNPEVADIPDRFKLDLDGVSLLVMGAVDRGDSGCACPEFVLVRNLIAYMLLNKNEDMVIDMEAGLEHLGRGVAANVDALLVVMQPNRVSCVTAARVRKLAGDLGIRKVFGVGNEIKDESDREYLAAEAGDLEILSFFPLSDEVARLERSGGDIFTIPAFREGAKILTDKIAEVGNE